MCVNTDVPSSLNTGTVTPAANYIESSSFGGVQTGARGKQQRKRINFIPLRLRLLFKTLDFASSRNGKLSFWFTNNSAQFSPPLLRVYTARRCGSLATEFS